MSATKNSKQEGNIAVECINLRKEYKLGDFTIQALQSINLKVKKGEFVAIMGPSGCGKTTLLNIIGTLDRPTDGKVIIENIDLANATEQQITFLRRFKIGIVFQFYNLLPVLTAFENVELPMIIAGVDKNVRQKRTLDLLKKVGLEGRMNHKPDELSGGERQRIAIARALANNPSILLADEPTGDLDSETGEQILELIRNINKEENQTVIMVTHDRKVAEEADIIYHMKDGLIVKTEIL